MTAWYAQSMVSTHLRRMQKIWVYLDYDSLSCSNMCLLYTERKWKNTKTVDFMPVFIHVILRHQLCHHSYKSKGISLQTKNDCLPVFMKILEGRYFRSLNRDFYCVGVCHEFITQWQSFNETIIAAAKNMSTIQNTFIVPMTLCIGFVCFLLTSVKSSN